MAESSIEWTEVTWNPTTGCDKISAGCKNCYAEVMARRLQAMGMEKYKDGFALRTHPSALLEPFKWRKPQVVFVNSMSDLFHPDVPLAFIKEVFWVMNKTPQHTYQILTKRAERVAELGHELNWTENIWMGVSVENQTFTKRVPYLQQVPAKTRFLSVEPLIGPIKQMSLDGIHWVIVGGESGWRARPMRKAWVDKVHQMCREADVPFFFKQWGKPYFNENPEDPTIDKEHPQHAKGGCQLDGEVYREMPRVA